MFLPIPLERWWSVSKATRMSSVQYATQAATELQRWKKERKRGGC